MQLVLKRGGAVQTDRRDHREDPGGQQHRQSFSLAFSFNESLQKEMREKVSVDEIHRPFLNLFSLTDPNSESVQACSEAAGHDKLFLLFIFTPHPSTAFAICSRLLEERV